MEGETFNENYSNDPAQLIFQFFEERNKNNHDSFETL